MQRADLQLERLALRIVGRRAQARRKPALATRDRPGLARIEPLRDPLEDVPEVSIVAPRKLDHECPHGAVLGPGTVGNAGRPEHGLTGCDPALLLADLHVAAALDNDEPCRVRVVVRLDAAALP